MQCGLIGHLLWEIQKVNLFYCYQQIYYQRQCLSYSEFLLQNLLCWTSCMLLIMRLVVFFGCIQSFSHGRRVFCGIILE